MLGNAPFCVSSCYASCSITAFYFKQEIIGCFLLVCGSPLDSMATPPCFCIIHCIVHIKTMCCFLLVCVSTLDSITSPDSASYIICTTSFELKEVVALISIRIDQTTD